MRCVQRRACPRPLHLNLFPTSTPPLINYLNEERAKRISADSRRDGKKAIVFGPGKYIGQRELTSMGITFCQLPYEMHVAR